MEFYERTKGGSYRPRSIPEKRLIKVPEAAVILGISFGTIVRLTECGVFTDFCPAPFKYGREFLLRDEVINLAQESLASREALINRARLGIDWFNRHGLKAIEPRKGNTAQCCVRPGAGFFLHGYVTLRMGFRGEPDRWIGHLHQVRVVGGIEQPSTEIFCRRNFSNPDETTDKVEAEIWRVIKAEGFE